MATNFPTSLDNLGNPAGSAPVNNPSHAAQHADVNDAIEALENKVGVNNSTVTTSLEYRVKNLETNPVVSYTDENARNAIGAALIGSGGITVTPNDSANTITVSTNNTIATKTYVDTAISGLASTSAETYVLDSLVGNPEGIATLDINSRVPLSQLGNLIDGAPLALDTLNELAAAINDDASYAATITTALGNKVSKAGGDVIVSSLPGVIGLTVKGAASQTANLTEWQNNSGTVLARVGSGGAIVTSGVGVFGSQSNTPNAQLYILSNNTSNPALVVEGASGQTSTNIFEVQRAGGGDASFRVSHNYIDLVRNTTAAASMTVYGPNAGAVPLYVKGRASQTANLTEWQNSSGSILARVTSSGVIGTTGNVYAGRYYFSNNGTDTGTSISFMDGSIGGGITIRNIDLGTPNAAFDNIVPLTVAGNINQTANLQEWKNASGTVLSSVRSDGMFFFPKARGTRLFAGSEPGDWSSYSLFSYSTTGSIVGLGVQANPSQTADLTQWKKSDGTVLTKISANGSLNFSQPAAISESIIDISIPAYHVYPGILTRSGTAWITALNPTGFDSYWQGRFYSRDVGTVALWVKGQASQTADLQQWQNSAGTVLAKVDSTGSMFTITAPANTNTTQVATTAYVQTELADLVNSAPATLDTLKELSDALGADANFATTVTNNLALKAPLASPTLTGTPTAPTAAVGTDTTQIATTAFVIDQIDASTQPGALYQTTAPTSPEIGQIWIDSDENVTTFDSNIIRRKSFTATAGQTVFVTDISFIDGFEQVFMNGLLLVKTTDYAVSGGNTVTLTSGASASDIIEVVSVTGANSVNTYTQAEVDALLAANTSVAPLSISANTTLVAKKRYFVTSASALTLTLPASPALNDEIQIVDASGNASTYNITVARNGNKINGGTGNLIIDNNGGWYTLLYTGATYGWKVG